MTFLLLKESNMCLQGLEYGHNYELPFILIMPAKSIAMFVNILHPDYYGILSIISEHHLW